MDRDKYILYISRWYPSEVDSMLGLFVKNHALAAAQAGFKVIVIYPAPINGTKINTGFSTNHEKGITEIILYYRKSSFLSSLSLFISWIKLIRQSIETNGRPALIHAHILTRAGILALILSKYLDVPYIITEHWSRYFDENLSFKGFIRKKLTQVVINNARSVTVVSERLATAMKKRGLKFNPELLNNVVDTAKFHIQTQKYPTFSFISISCFEEKSKNLIMLIDSITQISQSSEFPIDLLLIGDGVDRKKVEKYAVINGCPAKFMGTLPQEETAEILKRSHCLVLSSNYETFGIVAYEALACGLPVITTDVADLKKVIDEDSGFVIPVKDVESMVKAMKKVIENYNSYDPLKIRKKLETCSIASVSNSLSELYQGVI